MREREREREREMILANQIKTLSLKKKTLSKGKQEVRDK